MYTFLKKNNYFQCLCLAALLVGLSGCATQGMKLPQTLPEPDRTSAVSSEGLGQHKNASLKHIEVLHTLPVLGANHSPKDAAKRLDLPKGKLTLNANGLPLNQFIHLALGDVLHLAFEVDAAVAKRNDPVTLHVGKPIAASQILGLVEETLNLFGVVVLRGEHGLRVMPESALKALPARLSVKGVKVRKGQVAEVIPLKYLEMSELQAIVGSVFELGKYGRVHFNKRLNAVVAMGDASRVRRFKEFVDFLDRPSFEHRQLRLVRPIYWQANDLAKQLIQMLKVQGIPVSDRAEKAGSVIVLAIKPINALLVASPQAAWMQEAVSLIEHLDGPDAAGAGVRTFIYFTRYRAADELGSLISAALGGSAEQGGGQSSSSGGKSTAQKPRAASSGRAISAKKTRGLNVVVDAKRSALIFMGTSSAYQQVVPILERLDIPARQVLIEITIADVSLDDTNQLGVEWQFNNVDNSSVLTGTLSTLGGLGVGSAGLTYALADKLGNVRAKINALATKGKAKILSSPTLLAMDGEKAHMQVGTQISVVTQEVSNVQAGSGSSTSLLRSFQYIDTGVILDISPTITDYGSIRLELKQEVSEPGVGGVAGQPPIFKRIVDTVMVAESGQTVLLGGLITHNEAVNKTQVPLLGDIPLIGALFRSETIADRSTELIILITPHVIRGRDDAASLTESYRTRLGW